MENQANSYKIAGPAEQELPTGQSAVGLGNPLKRSNSNPGTRSDADHGPRSGINSLPEVPPQPFESSAPVLESEPPRTDRPLIQFEPLQSQITRKVHDMLEAGAGGLDVTLKPNGMPEIRLKLVREAGCIEAQAQCQRADYEVLNAGWSELRTALAGQGIQLQPLNELPAGSTHTNPSNPPAAGYSSHSNPDQRNRTPQQPDPRDQAGAPGTGSSTHLNRRAFFSGTTPITSPRPQPSNLRLLESWA